MPAKAVKVARIPGAVEEESVVVDAGQQRERGALWPIQGPQGAARAPAPGLSIFFAKVGRLHDRRGVGPERPEEPQGTNVDANQHVCGLGWHRLYDVPFDIHRVAQRAVVPFAHTTFADRIGQPRVDEAVLSHFGVFRVAREKEDPRHRFVAHGRVEPGRVRPLGPAPPRVREVYVGDARR